MLTVSREVSNLLQGRLLTESELRRWWPESQGKSKAELEASGFDVLPALTQSKGRWSCGRCHNQDPQQIGWIAPGPWTQTGRHYCQHCLVMGRVVEGEWLYYYRKGREAKFPVSPSREAGPAPSEILTWKGQLSAEQARASQALLDSLQEPGRPHLVHAVTGAGKTEMIFQVIAEVLSQQGRVAVASPRVDVCLELGPRLQAAFQGTDLLVLTGATAEPYRYTPLLVATTHQLLRFQQAFDLLIVDEVDAFPYVGDRSLHRAVERATKDGGKRIYLTATPDASLRGAIDRGELAVTTLPARYHGYPLPEPQCLWVGDWRASLTRLQRRTRLRRYLADFVQLGGTKLIFMPRIQLAEALYDQLPALTGSAPWACVHAQDPRRTQKVQALRDGDLDGLVTTTILERGVTFTQCQVCIVGADDRLFNASALVQMSGRVGRKPHHPTGAVWYLHDGHSRAMKSACRQIRSMNHLARQQGLLKEGY